MPAAKEWELLPSGDLADRSNWRPLGSNRYAALRVRVLIVKSNGKESRFGPVISAHNVAPDDTITLKRRRERVISWTDTISEAIRFTVTSRVCDQLTAKVSSELSAKIPGFSGKLQSEVLAETNHEITEGLEKILSTTTSHLIQEIEETEHIITLQGSGEHREAHLRRRFWPKYWDVYLHSFDYLELSYRRQWYWWEIRETIKKTYSGMLGWPLCSLTYYAPQSDVDICYGPVKNELDAPDLVEVNPLLTAMPSSRPPADEDLEELAKLAFPVTRKEKTRAERRKKKPKKAALKKKVAAKKKIVRKAAPKKKTDVKKKVEKKAAPKKKVTAKKKTTRKAVPKKRAARKR